MGSTSLTATTTLITGGAVNSGTTSASGDTVTITAPAEGPLDFSTLAIRVINPASDAATIVTLGIGTTYSSIALGTYAVTAASGKTIIIGGEDFEDARFKTDSETLVMTVTTPSGSGKSCLTSFEAYQAPYSHSG